MKHEKTLISLSAAFLAAVIAWGAVGCFGSAFDLPMTGPGVLAVCIASAGVFSLLFSIRFGGVAALCLLALAGGYGYRDGRIGSEFWQLLHHLTTIYHRAYGWSISPLPEGVAAGTEFDFLIAAWILLMTASVTWSICRRRSVILPVLTTLLPLCACIVVTDTVPGEPWLMTLMAGVILLILTASVRRENAFQGLWLTAAGAPAVSLALLLLFKAVPQECYVNHSDIFRENILIAAQNLPQLLDTGADQLTTPLRTLPKKQVDLAGVGARIPFTYPVMTVTAEKSGTLYLRSQDYDVYTGLGWSASEGREEPFSHTGGASQTITIRTEDRKAYRYLPYYPNADTLLTGGFGTNSDGREYTITHTTLPDNWREIAWQRTENPETLAHYLTLPEGIRQTSVSLTEHLYHPNSSNTARADVIAAFVTDSARYDLNPGKMPESEGDFALWFLREGESGYCVHFATAAAVLLRSAGVPARYVTGYTLEAEAGTAVTVTEEQSHAWVEYFEPSLGLWIPLEVTPAAEAPQMIPRPVPTAATEPEPAGTEAPAVETSPALPVLPDPPVTPAPVPEETPSKDLPVWLLWIPLLILALAGQRSLRLKLRRRRQHTGDPNAQALRRWREAVRLSRLLKESPTEELIHLAQKAKFSQHQLTQEELQQFDSFNRSCLRRLKAKPRYLQPVYRYIYAIY